jgi:cell division transport system permease protein
MRIGLVLGEAFSGLRRNASMVVSVVLVTFISLTFVGIAILLQTQIQSMRAYWYDRAQVAIYFCSTVDETGNCVQAAATDEEVAAVQAELVGDPLIDYVERAEYLTPQDPIANFLSPDLLGGIIRVTLYDPADADVVIESISGFAGVESVQDQRAYLEPIFALLGAASAAAIGVAVLMLVAAVLLIATTIRLSAFSRRRELGIMRLVGASNRFIETPFVLEGVLAALVGSLLASGAVIAIVQFFVGGTLGDAVGGSSLLVGVEDAIGVAPILVGIGVVLAALSASVAIRRYLKV